MNASVHGVGSAYPRHLERHGDVVRAVDAGTRRRQALVVLGMHRSGTSALAGTLGVLGAQFGHRMMPADHNNGHGYWENLRFVEENDRLLREFGSSWDAPFRMPHGWLDTPRGVQHVARLRRDLEDEFGNADIIAIKDPRVSRMVPLWERALIDADYEPAYLLMLRHPDEVAHSLKRRDGFTREKSHLLWLQHVLQSELETRGRRRAIVGFDDLIDDSEACIARLGRDLGVQWPQGAEQAMTRAADFLVPSLRHHRAAESPADSDPLAFVHDVYRRAMAFGRLSQGRPALALDVDHDAYSRLLETVLVQTTRAWHVASRKSLQLHQRLLRSRNEASKAAMVRVDAGHVHNEIPGAASTVAGAQVSSIRRNDLCKVYWRQDCEVYDEGRAHGVAYAFGQLDIAFDVACRCDVTPDFIRIDPSEWPGIFCLGDIAIDGTSMVDAGDRISLLNGQRLDATSDVLRFAALDADPYVEFDIRHLRSTGAKGAELRVAFHVARSEIQSELARVARREQAVETALAAQQVDISAMRTGLDALQAHALDQRDGVAAQLTDFANVRGAIDVCQALLDQHADLLDTMLADDAMLLQASAQATQQLDGIVGAIDALANQVASDAAQTGVAVEAMHGMSTRAVRQMDNVASAVDRLSGRVEGAALRVQGGFDAMSARVDAIDVQQAIALNWMRRRSPRYWWRRWFRG